MDMPVLADQQGLANISSVRTLDVVCREQKMLERETDRLIDRHTTESDGNP